MKPLQLKFLKSAATYEQLPPDSGNEIVFIGYSNVGKSSLINRICNQKNMAKTSRTPGRTQLFNIFEHSPNSRIIDVPGFGYAKASAHDQEIWRERLQHYLVNRESLKCILLVCDIRRDPREIDISMINWSLSNELPLILALNKSDKLSKNKQKQSAQQYQQLFKSNPLVSLIQCSCLNNEGIDSLVLSLQKALNKAHD